MTEKEFAELLEKIIRLYFLVECETQDIGGGRGWEVLDGIADYMCDIQKDDRTAYEQLALLFLENDLRKLKEANND